jgi:hypothetical protein
MIFMNAKQARTLLISRLLNCIVQGRFNTPSRLTSIQGRNHQMARHRQRKGLHQKDATAANHGRQERRFSVKVSSARQDWQRVKQSYDLSDDAVTAIDEIMALVGLKEVKEQVLAILKYVDVAKNQGVNLKKQRFHVVFQGNPGTGRQHSLPDWGPSTCR